MGHPTNQAQTLATLITFSMANIVGCQLLGMWFSRADRDAVYHAWRYVGFLLGVDPELLPADENDAWRAFWLAADSEFQPDEDALLLATALRKQWARGSSTRTSHSPAPGSGCSPDTCAPTEAGPGTRQRGRTRAARREGVPGDGRGQRAVNTLVDAAAVVVPGGRWFQATLGHRVRSRIIGRASRLHGADRGYVQHDRLAGNRPAGLRVI